MRTSIEMDRLRRDALGVDSQSSRSIAMVELARGDDASRASLLGTILLNAEEKLAVRMLAAELLGTIDRDSARDALQHALATTNDTLAGIVAQSLGRIGDAASLDALQARDDSLAGTDRERLRFAVLLLSHRLGSGRALPNAGALEYVEFAPDEAQHVPVSAAHQYVAPAALRDLEATPFGVEWNEPTGRIFGEGRAGAVLFLNRALGSPPNVERIYERSFLAGIVAQLAEDGGRYCPWLLVLTHPIAHERAARIALYRPHGQLVAAGTVEGTMQQNTIEVRTVTTPGAVAGRLRASLNGWRLHIDAAEVGLIRHGRRHPSPHSAPSRVVAPA